MSQSLEPCSGKIKSAIGTAEKIPFKSTLTVGSDRTNLESSRSRQGKVTATKSKADNASAKPDTPAPSTAEPISEGEVEHGPRFKGVKRIIISGFFVLFFLFVLIGSLGVVLKWTSPF